MDQRDFIGENGQRLQHLDAVRDALKTFITERDGDRMALIVFGTRAFVQALFTEVLQSLEEFLDQTQVCMEGPNTAIGDAIGLAIRMFDGSEVEDRLIIFLSDGVDTNSRVLSKRPPHRSDGKPRSAAGDTHGNHRALARYDPGSQPHAAV